MSLQGDDAFVGAADAVWKSGLRRLDSKWAEGLRRW